MAESTLSARGFNFHFQREPDHVVVWFDLARAYLGNDQPQEAAKWLQAVIDSGIERTFYPAWFAQAHYYLGLVADEAGDGSEAEKWFGEFLSLWGEGDVGGELVADARSRTD